LRAKRILGGLLLLAAIGAGGFAALAWRSEPDPVSPPDRSAFPPEKIAQGARLASLGYCIQCHTAPGGKPFAGGYTNGTEH
jgi:mono/diheme cytochrome c family protein